MEEKNNAPQPCGEKQPESKKFLVFYVIGLFCVALALILLSYIAQVRSDRRLNELTNQLSTQTSASKTKANVFRFLEWRCFFKGGPPAHVDKKS